MKPRFNAMFHHRVTQHVVIVLDSAAQYGHIMNIHESWSFRSYWWNAHSPMAPQNKYCCALHLTYDPFIHIYWQWTTCHFIQIYFLKHEPSTVQPSLPPCVVALPAFAASRRRNCAFRARQPRTMASAYQPLSECCLVTNRIPSWNMLVEVTTDPYDSTLHFATNQHPGAFQCVTYNSRQHSPFTSRVII